MAPDEASRFRGVSVPRVPWLDEVEIIESVYDDETTRELINQPKRCEQHPGMEWPHDDCAGPGFMGDA